MSAQRTPNVSAGHAPPAYRVRTAAAKQSRAAYEPEHRQDMAQAFGVSPSAISHRKNGNHRDPLSEVCEAIMKLEDDSAARAVLAVVESAYERRRLLRQDTPRLLSAFLMLWDREHTLDAEEDKQAALYMAGADGEAYTAVQRRCGTLLLLLAELRDELEDRGVDIRAIILRAR